MASVGGGFGCFTETSTCSVHNISVEVVVCLFVSCPFKLRMGVTLHVVVFHTGVKMEWSNLCNAWLGMLRSTRACASCFVHSVCQASSGEIHLCLKNSPNVLAGLNAILALVILPRCFLWPKCPTWLLMPAVFQKAAPATYVACVGDTILASDSEQGSWMPKVACRVYSTRASCAFACWCLTKQCSPCCPRSSAKNWTKWFCTMSCCPRFSIHVSSFEVCQ